MATAVELLEEVLREKRLTVVGRICILGIGAGGSIDQFIWVRLKPTMGNDLFSPTSS
jgi:hypothetical protein